MRKSSLALLKRFARDERGASMIEYGVLVGLITAAIVGILAAVGTDITARFQTLLTNLTANP